MIEGAVRNYKYFGSRLDDFMGLYTSLVNDTYGKNVTSGLNNGAGLSGNGFTGSGRIYTGAETLPNRGALGMLKEFDSSDGGGQRSSLDYSYSGYRSHQTNQLVLVIGGYWPKSTAAANNAVARLQIGNTDLWYKMEKGYIDYDKGANYGYRSQYSDSMQAFSYIRSLWEDVLAPYHLSAPDSDYDGTPDDVEIRLGTRSCQWLITFRNHDARSPAHLALRRRTFVLGATQQRRFTNDVANDRNGRWKCRNIRLYGPFTSGRQGPLSSGSQSLISHKTGGS